MAVAKAVSEFAKTSKLFTVRHASLEGNKVKGFAVGGDDYIVKPFSLVELEARVRAHLRREARHNFEAQVKFSGDLTQVRSKKADEKRQLFDFHKPVHN